MSGRRAVAVLLGLLGLYVLVNLCVGLVRAATGTVTTDLPTAGIVGIGLLVAPVGFGLLLAAWKVWR